MSVVRMFFLGLLLTQAGEYCHAADDLLTGSRSFLAEPQKPVFLSSPGQWDSKIRERGWVMKEADQWKMWYTGYSPDQQPPLMKLGYATSPDGITWTRHPQNPLISDFWVEDMMVVRHGDRYLMFAEGAGDQAQLLESADGIQWKRIGTLDVRLANGQPIPAGPFGTPTAWFENGTWNLFYERRDAGIWLARSTDMKVWTNVSDEPLIKPGPETFDSVMIAMNQIIKQNDKYIAVLHGTGSPEKPREWCTYLAESSDLLHWTKLSSGPLRPISENKSSGQLVHDGTKWILFTMHDQVHRHLSP